MPAEEPTMEKAAGPSFAPNHEKGWQKGMFDDVKRTTKKFFLLVILILLLGGISYMAVTLSKS